MNRELVVGMKLTVREDLNVDLECESGVVEDMMELVGKEVTVSRLTTKGSFEIKEDESIWLWDKCMFKEFTEEVKA